jgi:hypothetical protein
MSRRWRSAEVEDRFCTTNMSPRCGSGKTGYMLFNKHVFEALEIMAEREFYKHYAALPLEENDIFKFYIFFPQSYIISTNVRISYLCLNPL